MRKLILVLIPLILAWVFVVVPHPAKTGLYNLPKGDQPLISCDYVGMGQNTTVKLRGFPFINKDSFDDHHACLSSQEYSHTNKAIVDAALGIVIGIIASLILVKLGRKK